MKIEIDDKNVVVDGTQIPFEVLSAIAHHEPNNLERRAAGLLREGMAFLLLREFEPWRKQCDQWLIDAGFEEK